MTLRLISATPDTVRNVPLFFRDQCQAHSGGYKHRLDRRICHLLLTIRLDNMVRDSFLALVAFREDGLHCWNGIGLKAPYFKVPGRASDRVTPC